MEEKLEIRSDIKREKGDAWVNQVNLVDQETIINKESLP